MDPIALIKEFGFPVACALLVGFAFWKHIQAQLKELRGVINKQDARIEELQRDRLERAERYAVLLRDLAAKIGGVLSEHTAEQRAWRKTIVEQNESIQQIIEALRGSRDSDDIKVPEVHRRHRPRPEDTATDYLPAIQPPSQDHA